MKITTLTKTTLPFAAVALLAATSQAAVINVDIQGSGTNGSSAVNDYTGALANGPIISSTTWNHFNVGGDPPTGSMLDLVDDSGVATTVDISFGAGWTGSFSDGLPNYLQGDRTYGVGTNIGAVTISGLVSGGTYNLAFLTGVDATGAQATDFTIGGTTLTATAVTGAGTDLNGALTFTDGVTHVLFSDVVATGGSITFSTSTAESAFVLSGVQIEAIPVPEPTTTALLGLGGLALILRRRK